ncbi:hypothetical protein PAHAL_1G148700 [Panicum hallii]|uniref:Signal recognition particle 19 kDa protein n=1 Tax=Panicum hallii TaxID=206008 RepID=A0A2S3GP76_9POAL|nr:signal recognition particle 19 kDa protein-like [Panicum hallii]PAN05666.1 hypothetical protein PAHAL_1G148700 [Panicum hallii]PAN05667.1 hypothetical protein PAHAL_1G148700 [Panicum hallii]
MDVAGEARVTSSKKWSVVYPVYINSRKLGRRVAADKACPDPTCGEIADCCSHLKIPCRIESDKSYPRDFLQVGRVRVQLKRDDGFPVNPEIVTRKNLWLTTGLLYNRFCLPCQPWVPSARH